jgi:hypothetical protein
LSFSIEQLLVCIAVAAIFLTGVANAGKVIVRPIIGRSDRCWSATTND